MLVTSMRHSVEMFCAAILSLTAMISIAVLVTVFLLGVGAALMTLAVMSVAGAL